MKYDCAISIKSEAISICWMDLLRSKQFFRACKDKIGECCRVDIRRRASIGDVASGSALSTKERGRSTNRGNKKGKEIVTSKNRGMTKSHGGDVKWVVGTVVRRGTRNKIVRHRWNNRVGIIEEVRAPLLLQMSPTMRLWFVCWVFTVGP